MFTDNLKMKIWRISQASNLHVLPLVRICMQIVGVVIRSDSDVHASEVTSLTLDQRKLLEASAKAMQERDTIAQSMSTGVFLEQWLSANC